VQRERAGARVVAQLTIARLSANQPAASEAGAVLPHAGWFGRTR